MADEATGTLVTPPAGFQLRAFLADPATTTVKNITALTDMAVAIAGTSPTLSATAASNAESAIIATVLGGDIGAYQATPLPPTAAAMATASADEKKLATMLTAVSAFAQDGTTAAACGTLTDTAAKIQCAIGAFEAQAAATVTSVSDAGYTIATNVPANTPATMLAGTLAQITAEAASGITGGLVTATGPQALASTITADSSGSAVLLASASVSVLAAASTGGVVALAAAATGVQAASNLFNSLKTDLSSLTNSSGTGFLDQKVSAMTADFNSLAITSVTSSTKNIKALSRALQMANDAQTALWAIPGTAPNTVYPVPNSDVALETNSTGAPLRFVRSHGDGMNCYVNYADTTTSATLVSVAVTPAVASIPILGIQPFTLTAVYSDGSTLNVTAAPTTTWTSATTGVATVVPTTGVATGVTAGTSVITAAFGGKTSTATLTVTSATLVSLAVTPATASTTLGKAGCYYSDGIANSSTVSGVFTGYYHAVEVAESTTTPGTYSWQDYLASRTYTTTLFGNPNYYPITGNGNYVPTTAAEVATSTIQTGTAVMTFGSNENITAGSVIGNIQPLVAGQDYSTLNITGMSSSISATEEVYSFAGTVTNVTGTTTTLSMALQSGSQAVDVPGNGALGVAGHPISGKFIFQIKTTSFEYDGTLTVNAFTKDLDPSNTDYMPANASFSGTISTLASGTATAFLSGTLGATLANVAAYDPTQPTTATNYLQPTATFLGTVINGSTSYELTVIADGSVYNQLSVTLNYARAGSQMISVTGTHSPTTNTLTIYGTGGVNAVLTNGTGNVYTGTTEVGTITQNPSEVTFTDGTYLLLGV
jgi:hypothetical protein